MSEEKIETFNAASRDKMRQELRWRRAHILSPFVNAWLIIFVFIFTVGREFFEIGTQNDREIPDFSQAPELPGVLSIFENFGMLWLPALLLVGFAVLLIPYFVSWYSYFFAVDAHNVYVRSGILSKTERKARLDRVQSIDINRSLMARLLGLAELKFDVADGSHSALAVKFLKYKDARALRAQLLSQVRALKEADAGENLAPVTDAVSSLGDGEPEHTEPTRRERLREHVATNLGSGLKDADETPVLKIPVARLIASVLLSFTTCVTVLGVAFFVGLSLFTGASLVSILFANFALIAGLGSALWKKFNTGYNFRLSTSPVGLKTRYGFTDTTTQTVPAGRVQSITVTQPLLWRLKGWYQVRVALAGKGGTENTFTGYLLPVGTADDLARVLPLVVPGAGSGGADAEALRAGLVGSGFAGGFTVSPRRARVFNWLTYKRNGFAILPAVLMIRGGWAVRRLVLVPHGKVQGIRVSQGPFARRRSVAHLSVDVAGHSATYPATVQNADAAVARALFVRQAQLGVRPASL